MPPTIVACVGGAAHGEGRRRGITREVQCRRPPRQPHPKPAPRHHPPDRRIKLSSCRGVADTILRLMPMLRISTYWRDSSCRHIDTRMAGRAWGRRGEADGLHARRLLLRYGT